MLLSRSLLSPETPTCPVANGVNLLGEDGKNMLQDC